MDNKKCEYWRSSSKIIGWDNDVPILDETYEYCIGTKEQEICKCKGDKNKCDFYPEKREENIITKNTNIKNTAEMWLDAQNTGKSYQSTNGNFIYQANKGLFYKATMKRCPLEMWDIEEDNALNNLMKTEWKECKNILTKTEAENKYNIKIIEDY